MREAAPDLKRYFHQVPAVSSLFAEVACIFKADPENPVRYRQGRPS